MSLSNRFSLLILPAILAAFVLMSPNIASAQKFFKASHSRLSPSGERGIAFKAVDSLQRVRGSWYSTGYHYHSPACYPHVGWSPYDNLMHLQQAQPWDSQPVYQSAPQFQYQDHSHDHANDQQHDHGKPEMPSRPKQKSSNDKGASDKESHDDGKADDAHKDGKADDAHEADGRKDSPEDKPKPKPDAERLETQNRNSDPIDSYFQQTGFGE